MAYILLILAWISVSNDRRPRSARDVVQNLTGVAGAVPWGTTSGASPVTAAFILP